MATRVLSEEEYRDFDYKYNNLPDNDTRVTELGIIIIVIRKINK
jgi:hypothetical protein